MRANEASHMQVVTPQCMTIRGRQVNKETQWVCSMKIYKAILRVRQIQYPALGDIPLERAD